MKTISLYLLFLLLSASIFAQKDCISSSTLTDSYVYENDYGEEYKLEYSYKEIICDQVDTSIVLHGNYKVFTMDGILIQSTYFKNDKEDGPTRDYYSNGSLKMISHFKNGVLDEINAIYSIESKLLDTNILMNGSGMYKYYDDKGRLLSELELVDNVVTGKEILYDTLGNKIAEGNYLNDEKNGTYQFFYANNMVKSSSIFKNDILVGEYLEYYETGEIKTRAEYKYPPYNHSDSLHLGLIIRNDTDILNLLELFDPAGFHKGILIGEKLHYSIDGEILDK